MTRKEIPKDVPTEASKDVSGNREKILATALMLFVERGFSGTPTALISKKAGVATGTLFFYFKTKEELIDALYMRIKSEAAEALCQGIGKEKTAAEKLKHIGANAVAWGIQNPDKMKFMEQFANSPFVSVGAHEEGMSRFLFLQDIVQDGILEGSIQKIDKTLIFSILASSVAGIIERVSAEHDPDRRQELVDEGLRLIFGGLMA